MAEQFNFRVSDEIKKAFIEKARENGTSATELLVDFMCRYAGLQPNPPEAAVTLTELEKHLAPLQERLTALEIQCLGKSKKGAYIIR